jgi:hypothetical protein
MIRWFSSFAKPGTLRERWGYALRDPGYWLAWLVVILSFVFVVAE